MGVKTIAAIILSAGQSKRMDRPKQLLSFKGITLIEDVILKLEALDLEKIICITGHQNEQIEKHIASFDIECLYNEHYKNGISSSIASGISYLKESLIINGALIVLTDQPLIPKSHYQLLINTFKNNKQKIIATSYKETYGVPAIFDQSLFPKLVALKKDQGAKSLIKELINEVVLVECKEAANDIDTIEDYKNLINL